MADVVMPRLSDSMEEGTILQWLKQVGDEVAVGEELVEIETDKANMAYESDLSGTLTEILAQEGETLPIGTPIARIGDSGEGSGAPAAGPATEGEGSAGGGTASVLDPSPSAPPAEGASETAPEGPGAAINAPAEAAPSGTQADGERLRASPLAKRMAKERGLDLEPALGLGAWRSDRQGGRGQGGFVGGWRGCGGAEDGGPAPARRPPRSSGQAPRSKPPRARSY